jgi:rRNA-processing protein FCF1
MGKGNFFKKNIKKRKKERKERGIKQKILEQKKKVEEKLHHVVEIVSENQNSSEPELVVEKPVEEVKPEPVVEKPVEEVKPEPVVEKPVKETNMQHLIFDESIISYIMLDNREIIERLQKFSEKEIKFLTFDAVINFFIENERVTYNRILTFDQVVDKLKQIGDFQYYGFDEDSAIGQRANTLFEAEKYIDNSDILEEKKLSKTDCVLIELLIDKSVILVTNNELLKKATTQEAKERNVTVKIFDPLEL